MKNLRRICCGLLLVLALAIPAFAGETSAPPGETSTPPGEMNSPPGPGLTMTVLGETQGPSIQQEADLAGDILTPGLSLVISFLL